MRQVRKRHKSARWKSRLRNSVAFVCLKRLNFRNSERSRSKRTSKNTARVSLRRIADSRISRDSEKKKTRKLYPMERTYWVNFSKRRSI